ncbi:BMP family lipoprotein [Paenibacillus sp. DMB20]|uniref:BMP family lipoprotein n=1 Tax=Paenibacillus sp. DMB20 TaxID=1642570 RepID=UPI0006280431|nr:BMP family ABC transporter substrate-binding protein [Paenibacillus sp. DMB20]KKO54418.1 membrane protein [Paenibacillus sp. DMB20]
MKKGVISLISLALSVTMLAGCGDKPGKETSGGAGGDAPKANFKVGMVTDAGTIDDKSFNQGTYEGIVKANKDFNMEYKYLKPAGTTEADYSKEIGNLYDAGYKFIVTPGFKFETAIFKSQDKFKDAKFVLIDGAPHAGDNKPVVKENTVSIFFAEHEAGFLAGVAAALHVKDGQAGFIGGMEIPPVQKFNWGFQQGVAYANENLGTKVTINKENVVYQGSFDNVAAGSQLAAQMYDRGVNVIFAAAGGVGVGAINEAKTRAQKGDDVWTVGVDVDQYKDGVYEGEKSVILTSAVKKIDQAAYDMIKAETEGKFPGGQTLTLDAKNDAVGLPEKNPNLSDEIVKQVDEVYNKIKSGEVKVAGEQGELIK